MALGDMENECLSYLQAPGVNVTTSPLPYPNWAAMPQTLIFSQGIVDYAINRGYFRLMSDLSGTEIFLQTITFPSIANTNQYALPTQAGVTPSNPPAIAKVMRVYYMPQGLLYTKEFAPQVQFRSWNDYQVQTGLGVLAPYAYGTQPDFVAVMPNRSQLAFFPGSAATGDTITVQYTPLPTAGSVVPPLINQSDVMVLPTDCEEAVVQWALSILFRRQTEPGQSELCKKEYQNELTRIKDVYSASSSQDSISITNFSPYDLNDAYMAGGLLP